MMTCAVVRDTGGVIFRKESKNEENKCVRGEWSSDDYETEEEEEESDPEYIDEDSDMSDNTKVEVRRYNV